MTASNAFTGTEPGHLLDQPRSLAVDSTVAVISACLPRRSVSGLDDLLGCLRPCAPIRTRPSRRDASAVRAIRVWCARAEVRA